MNIIFLDIDGVLNYLNYFKYIHNQVINYNKTNINNILTKLLEIDINKLLILKELCLITNSKIVITSSWKILNNYPKIEEYLIKYIPIIDTTKYLYNQRGLEIKNYLKNHPEITNYVILDDDIFPDYDEELLYHLIHTNFYNEGLDYDNYKDIIYKLKTKKFDKYY